MNRTTEPVPEAAVRLLANDVAIGTWTASPRGLAALGAGRLMSLGYVRGAGDILDTRVVSPGETADGIWRIEVTVPKERMAVGIEERDHRAWNGCGLRHLLDCRPDLLPERDADHTLSVPHLEAFPELFRELFDRSPSRKTTGGHHTTALTDGRVLVHLYEVIGRHNGADKAIGGALLSADRLPGLGLLTTARISGQIAEKTARAGVAWVASRSVPTTLAVEIARAAGLPLIARAAGKDARVFA
ncbi:MAG: formate dehydrogenase accessory sulfurtransferase FdhD [Longimicrobiales bacterium]